MLVVCGDDFLSTIKPFIDWKNQKGIKTTLVPISQIGNSQLLIYDFVSNYYAANPDLLYLLFVGDHADINAADAGMAGSEVKWSDTYYTFLNGADYYPELFVGRFSGSTTIDIQTMVDRTLEYEKTPVSGNWYSTAIGIGSDEGDGYGDDGEADWQHQRNMATKLLSWGYSTYHEFYDGSHGGNDAAGDPTTSMVSTEVNNGASLFLYTGHGWEGGCATSNYSSTEAAVSTNNGKYPFAVSVACNNGTFTAATCFAEEFVRARNNNGPTGAIACSGSSILMAWAEPMAVQDEIVEILADQYATNKKITLGGLFYNGGLKMLDDYGNPTAEEVMETWVLFGDPSCVIRTQIPTQITATHDACYTGGTNTLSINSPNEGALVALSVNDSLLGTAYIQAGTANVSFTSNTTSPLTLIISGYNKLPLQSTIVPCAIGLLNQAQKNEFDVYPNPAQNTISIQTTIGNYEFKLIDALGRIVIEQKVKETSTTIDLSALAKGFYTLQFLSQEKKITKKVLIN
jgi:gingipain R